MKLFVCVGTQKFPFDRLLRLADKLAAEPGYQVFAQSGYSEYRPQHYRSEPFLTKDVFEQQIRDCDLLLTHGGVSTIITGLREGKTILVLPRLAKYGEHVDDHQIQIARSFAEKNLVLCCEEGEELAGCIARAQAAQFAPYVSHRADMIEVIEQYLAGLKR